ncbi:MAG TPA: VOC family protein [Rhodoglobus sp.]|nr:VOC family protein [Rhodoglobus sp.]HQA22176.1 VOC family protein [Rhodoglobus sp.]HQE47430.1 VOC family protein [Rhodoglobus sp.]
MATITPFLWLNHPIDEVIAYYSSVFDGVIVNDEQRMPDGSLLTATVTIAGQRIGLLSGGPEVPPSDAFSLMVSVETQDEVDSYWNALTADGGQESQCGWLKDKYGISWQIIPTALGRLIGDPDPARAGRAMQAMFAMRKIVIADLEAAAAG